TVQSARHTEAVKMRDEEVKAAREIANPVMSKVNSTREAAYAKAKAEYTRQLSQIEQRRDRDLLASEQSLRQTLNELKHRQEAETKSANQRHADQQRHDEDHYRQRRAELEKRWYDGLREIQTPITHGDGNGAATAGQRPAPPA